MLTRRTPAQQEASRRNGAKSGGPATQEGHAKSRRKSSFTNCQLRRTIVIAGEDPTRFKLLLDSLRAQYQPSNPTEEYLVEDLACYRWRQWRFTAMETALYTGEIERQVDFHPGTQASNAGRAVQALTIISGNRSLDVIHRQEMRFSRQFNRTLNQLLALRAAEKVKKSGLDLPGIENTESST